MNIAVIVLTFNSEKHIPDLLNSLKNTIAPPGTNIEIIFVDNASDDNTIPLLEKTNYHIIRNDKNEGFAGGNNVGMRYALKRGADFIVLLNDDTVVTENWIVEMYSVHRKNIDAGAVQPLLLYWDDKNLVNSWGNYIHFLGFGFAGGNLQDKKEAYKKPHVYQVSYCSGACVMYRSEALKKAGLFNAILESYHEDLEISLNMKLYGYKSYTTRDAIVYHKYKFLKSNKSIGGNYKYYLMERNRMFVLLKYYSLRMLIMVFPMWFVMEVGTFGFSIIRGFWKEKLRAYVWIAKHIGLILFERRETYRLRRESKISEKEFTEDFVGEIAFQEINNPILLYIANPVTRFYWKIIRTVL